MLLSVPNYFEVSNKLVPAKRLKVSLRRDGGKNYSGRISADAPFVLNRNLVALIFFFSLLAIDDCQEVGPLIYGARVVYLCFPQHPIGIVHA